MMPKSFFEPAGPKIRAKVIDQAKRHARKKKKLLNLHEKQVMATYFHPWAGASIHPKIPDGSMNQSTGVSSRNIMTMDIREKFLQETDEVLELILYPGINGGIVCNFLRDESSQVLGAVYGSQYHGNILDIDVNTDLDGDGEQAVFKVFNGKLTKWRTVSQALHIALLNPSESNEGWWEACRITPNINDFCATPINNSTNNQESVSFHPDLEKVKTILADVMADEPSYVNGTLRDIHKHTFKLQHNDKNHLWQECPEFVRPAMMSWDNTNHVYRNNQLFKDTSQSMFTTDREATRSLVYQGMDCIYLRIHPRSSTLGGSQIKIDQVMNHEIIYSASNELSNHMSDKASPDLQTQFKNVFANIHENSSAATQIMDTVSQTVKATGATIADINSFVTGLGLGN